MRERWHSTGYTGAFAETLFESVHAEARPEISVGQEVREMHGLWRPGQDEAQPVLRERMQVRGSAGAEAGGELQALWSDVSAPERFTRSTQVLLAAVCIRGAGKTQRRA